MSVTIDLLKCVGCGACTYVCPVGVLAVIDMKCRLKEGCIACGDCVDACHWQAMTLEDGPDRGNVTTTSKNRRVKEIVRKLPFPN